MTHRYEVNIDRLDDLVARLRGLHEFVGVDLDELERRIAALYESWAGVAADGHLAAHRRWRAGAAEVLDGLATMEDAVGRATAAYRDVTEVNSRMFRR